MYVLVACPENSLINSKELNKPIITLYELEIAFNCARLWGEEFICDYKQILTGSDHYVPLKLTDQESDVMFINKIEFNTKYFPCFSKWGGGAINCGAIQTSNLTSLTFI